jgi:hypothetical protein
MIPDKFCINGREYTVYNIYYDTKNCDIIRHSISGPNFKEKLRLRSYTPTDDPDANVYIEIKKKVNGVVSKRRAGISLLESQRLIDSGIIPNTDGYINRQVLNEISYYLKVNKVMPSVFIRYDRCALFGRDNPEFRITFDRNIMARRDNLSLIPSKNDYKVIDDNMYVMEIKIQGAVPYELSHLLSELGIYSHSFSKYGQEFKNYVSPDIITPLFEPTNIKSAAINF